MVRITAGEVSALMEERLGLPAAGPEQHLFDTGVLDSLSFVNLLVELETEFDVTLPLDQIDFEDFSTTARIAQFVAMAPSRALSEAG